jgi:hypothetical protein
MTGSIQQAATEILALINSRPTSPREAEIAAVIGRVGTGALAAMSPQHAELHCEWRALVEENIREFGPDSDEGLSEAEIAAEEDRLAAHMDLIFDLAWRILEAPARTWGDVLAYAEVCFWGHWHVDPQGPDTERWLQGGPHSEGELGNKALAKVLGAVFSLARPPGGGKD